MSELPEDRRAVTVTDTVAVATLVTVSVVLAGGLGVAVLVGDGASDGPPQTNFSFTHFDRDAELVVTHQRGDEIEAGSIELTSGEASATWAAVAGTNNSTMVSAGDTVQLSRQSAFGAPVRGDDSVEVVWTGGNQTVVLDRWDGGNG